MLQWPGPCDPLWLGSGPRKLASGWPGYLSVSDHAGRIFCVFIRFFSKSLWVQERQTHLLTLVDEFLPPINDGIKSLDVRWMIDARSVRSLVTGRGPCLVTRGGAPTHQAGAASQIRRLSLESSSLLGSLAQSNAGSLVFKIENQPRFGFGGPIFRS